MDKTIVNFNDCHMQPKLKSCLSMVNGSIFEVVVGISDGAGDHYLLGMQQRPKMRESVEKVIQGVMMDQMDIYVQVLPLDAATTSQQQDGGDLGLAVSFLLVALLKGRSVPDNKTFLIVSEVDIKGTTKSSGQLSSDADTAKLLDFIRNDAPSHPVHLIMGEGSREGFEKKQLGRISRKLIKYYFLSVAELEGHVLDGKAIRHTPAPRIGYDLALGRGEASQQGAYIDDFMMDV